MAHIVDLDRAAPPWFRRGRAPDKGVAVSSKPTLSHRDEAGMRDRMRRRLDGRTARAVAALGRAEGRRFLRFCCVGGVGFCVDAAALLAFVHLCGVDPISARLLSAVAGILTTFELNRRWAFRGVEAPGYGAALARYVAVQSLGLACNVAIYTGCYLLLPRPLNAPLVCLAVASGTAMLLNYVGASRLVFRGA